MTNNITRAERRLELLVKARELISDPAGWIKGQMFDDGAYSSGKVCARCAWGALWEADLGDDVTNVQRPIRWPVMEAKQWLKEVVLEGTMGIHIYNDRDDTTHDDILQLFDRGIVLARAELEKARHEEIPTQLHSACKFDDENKACWEDPDDEDNYNPIPASNLALLVLVGVIVASLLVFALGGS